MDNEKNIPFCLTLPGNGDKYKAIIKPPITVSMSSGLVQLAPGENVGLHSTKNNEELLIILDGEGQVEMEGCAAITIKGGQVAYVPPLTNHNVFNTGLSPLKYIFVVSKAVA